MVHCWVESGESHQFQLLPCPKLGPVSLDLNYISQLFREESSYSVSSIIPTFKVRGYCFNMPIKSIFGWSHQIRICR